MNKTSKLLPIFICLFLGVLILYFLVSPIFVPEETFNGFSGDYNQSIIISSSTGEMKGLEVGVASYAGKEGIPLILSSKTIPYPLNEWIPLLKEKANIKKVILIGPVSIWQVYSLKMLNLKVEWINGSTKSEILTEIAEKTYRSQDTVIITASDPSASLLGAYMDVPVFVVAEPGKYTSYDTLPMEYDGYLSKYDVKNVIIVGSVSKGILENLNTKNITLDEIKGNDSYQTSVLVSDRIVNLKKQQGFEVSSAYCGFYGELPAIIPLAVHNNSIILIDPTLHMDESVNYLKARDIDSAIITRNGPADYLQMEEPDFVSSTLINKMRSAGINVSYLTNFRTINEATGLYETKMMAAEQLSETGNLWDNNRELNLPNFPIGLMNIKILDTGLIYTTEYPPILDIVLKGGNWYSTTGSKLNIRQIGINQWFYVWKGIHPYVWQRNNFNDWYCYSGSGYSWHWIHANVTSDGTPANSTFDTWTVEYLSNKKVYNRVYWVKKGNIWEEIHSESSFNWRYDLYSWICYQGDQTFVLYPIYLNFNPGVI